MILVLKACKEKYQLQLQQLPGEERIRRRMMRRGAKQVGRSREAGRTAAITAG